MKIRLPHMLWQGLLSLFTLWGMAGCADEAPALTPPATTGGGDEPVMIRATMLGTSLATRNGSSYDPGSPTPITGRTLLFTFPAKLDGKMKSLPCEFDGQGIGYIYYEDSNKQRQQLRWRDIDTEPANNAVYLDNLVNYPVQEGDFANSDPLKKYDNFTKMRFGPPAKNYEYPLIEGGQTVSAYREQGDGEGKTCLYKWTIAPDDSQYAREVDLIWAQFPGRINGTSPGGGVLDGTLADHIGQPIHFEMEHKMSTILFRFYCDDEEEELKELLARQNAIVFMDDMRVWLEHKNSIGEGTNETEEQDSKRSIPFKRQNGVIDNGGLSIQDGVLLATTLKKEEPTSASSERTYYSTPTWIIPPVREGGTRPTLTIQLGNYKFSGMLPQYMKYWSKDTEGNWHLSDPVLLGFKEGYRHTINVKLKMNLGTPDLIFNLVEVSPWGSYSFNENSTAGESGIQSWEDLKYVAGLHNENPGEENYKLMRYGTWSTDSKWIFQLWRDIVIPTDDSYQLFTHDNFKIERGSYKITQGENPIKDEDLKKTKEQ